MDDSAVVWFRRDLRTADHPALLAAADAAKRSLALFVLDEKLLDPSGDARKAFLTGCLRDLESQLDGRLLVVRGDPADVLPRVARAVGAGSVHVSEDFGPYGRKRDENVAAALKESDVEFVPTGSPYAISPGRVRKNDGDPFKVFTPFSRAWREHGWRAPADSDASTVDWIDPSEKDGGPRAVKIPDAPALSGVTLPEVGEQAARAAWRNFVGDHLAEYESARDRPDHDATSRMSAYLRWGCLHPRTLLADLESRSGTGVDTYRTELAWREFYADVLFHHPDSARYNYDRKFDKMRHDTDADAWDRFELWQRGETGYPIVDAGMRQLLAEGWMHNRLRMIVASFLVKDLHVPWWWGARHFMRHLVDGDLASNQHGWQWVAGSGTDAAPYFRIFNPTTQGERFDPKGDYVRRHVPELRGVQGKAVHQPWKLRDDAPADYPKPLVDHAEERQVSLDRFAATKS